MEVRVFDAMSPEEEEEEVAKRSLEEADDLVDMVRRVKGARVSVDLAVGDLMSQPTFLSLSLFLARKSGRDRTCIGRHHPDALRPSSSTHPNLPIMSPNPSLIRMSPIPLVRSPPTSPTSPTSSFTSPSPSPASASACATMRRPTLFDRDEMIHVRGELVAGFEGGCFAGLEGMDEDGLGREGWGEC